PVELRRRPDIVSRIRPRAARALEPGTLPLAVRHRGASGFCRVPLADLRALDVRTGDAAPLRPPLPDRGADPGAAAAPPARGENLQPGLRYRRIRRLCPLRSEERRVGKECRAR